MTTQAFEVDIRDSLAQLSRIATAAQRLDVIRAGIAESLAPIIGSARSIVQQPGKAGYNPRYGQRKTKKQLVNTIGQLARVYQNTVVGVVGPQAPAGAHGHLVERGHRVVTGGSVARQGQPKIKWRPGGPGRPPRNIFAKGAPRSRRGRTGQGQVVGQSQAFPFMEPAYNANLSTMTTHMQETMRRHVEQAVAAGGGASG